MADEWKELSLREAGVQLLDCDHKTPAAVTDGYPYIAIPQLKNGRIDLSDARRITRDDYLAWTRKTKPQEWDVIVSRRCNPGETAVVPADLECALGQNLVILRSTDGRVFPPFLRWLLRSPAWWDQVRTFINVGAVFESLKCADIPNFRVPIPPLKEQHAIACILGALDDKIELNRRRNRTLEAMARAIFQSWFVDFDPVKAKAAGRTPPGLSPALAALFPDSFTDSALGPIPTGWRMGVVGDIASQAIGGQWGSDNHEQDLAPAICLRGCDMEDLRTKGFAPDAPTRFVKPNAITTRLPTDADILIAASGAGPCGRPLWFSPALSALYQAPVIYSNFVKRLTTPSTAHAIYLDQVLIQKFRDRTIHDYINGTSVPNLDAKGLLGGCSILIPSDRLLGAFLSFCRPIYEALYSKENVTLAALRDALLPKLISGELRVPDAERIVGRAT